MEKYIWDFTGWIYENYGQTGCVISLLIMLSALTLAFFLLNLLPESKTVIIWSKCTSCKYRCMESNVFVLACAKHETPRFFDFRSPPCPRISYEDRSVIHDQSNPAIFRRDSLPEALGEI